MIELTNIESLNRLQRLAAAVDLWAAVDSIPNLKRELPLPANGYGRFPGFGSGYRRLGRIARTAEAHSLQAFVIDFNSPQRPRFHAIGMATAQKAQDNWAKPEGVELSYWFKAEKPLVRSIGEKVVNQLIVASAELSNVEQEAERWMVTLPEDELKTAVCQATGFRPVGEPQVYDLEDDVSEPRQLWVWQPERPN